MQVTTADIPTLDYFTSAVDGWERALRAEDLLRRINARWEQRGVIGDDTEGKQLIVEVRTLLSKESGGQG